MKKLLIFLLAIFLVNTSFTRKLHPYHVGSVEVNYSDKSKTYQITARLFIDDLEAAVNKKYGKNLHFQDEKDKAAMNDALKSYCSEYFKLKSDNKFLKINYLGFEEDKESVDIYLESEETPHPEKVETAVSFLYNLYDDQMNIVHIIVGGQRKSQKLNYPDRYLYQNF